MGEKDDGKWRGGGGCPSLCQRRGSARDGSVAQLGFRAWEPLLEGRGEYGITVHLDPMVLGLAATHQHPVESLGGAAHRDISPGVDRLGHALSAFGANHPLTSTV